MRTPFIGRSLLLGLLLPAALAAQTTARITGAIRSEAGQPVSRAQVSVQGTRLGAIADSLGRFSISNVPVGQYIVRASSLGFAPRQLAVTVTAGGTAVVDFSLATVGVALDRVVVTGYGTQRQGEITGSVSSVESKDFVQGPARDAASLIAGKVPGLAVTTPSGDPRRGSEISLRGVTTIQGSRNPLVLVDGVPGNLETVPAQDIEAVSVLKDGSAAAVYGSRASNGVILVTTKRHDGGRNTLRYDTFLSSQRISNRPDFLNAADYVRLRSQGYAFDTLGYATDWIAQMTRQPVSQRQTVSLSGGAATTNYNASLNYENAQGVFKRSDNKEISTLGNIRHTMFNGKLDADLRFVGRTQTFFNGPNFDNAWRQALIRNPTDRVTTDEGLWQERGTYMYTNPIGLITEQNGQVEARDQRLHGTATLRPSEHLRLSLMGGTSRRSSIGGSATTFRHVNTTQLGRSGEAARTTSADLDQILEATGTYSNSFGGHSINLLGGYGYQDFINESFQASNFQFPTDLFGFDRLQSGTALTDGKASMSSDKSSYKLIGFFSRVNYDWNNRFLLMASVRKEGNSRFGAGNKWGMFPAVSAAWRLSEEGFIRRFPVVNDLKLRLGYGVTGIAPNDSYLSLTSYTYGQRFLYNGQWVQGLAPNRNPNPDLRWEQKDEINTGIDFSMFNSRLNGAVDVYRRDTKNMLYNFSVPVPPYLFNNMLANVGHMQNDGVEAQLSYDAFRGSRVRWTTSANWSTNRNKLVSLSDATFRPQSDFFFAGGTGEPIQQSTHRVDIGGPIGNFYGFKSVDIDANGEWIVLDKNNLPIPIRRVTQDDRHVLGNGLPKQYAAWNNNVRVGNFDLDANLRGAFKFQILNFQRMYYENPKIVQYNMLRSAFDSVYGKRPVSYDLAYVSYYVEDGDYVKLDNVTLGYTVDARLLSRMTNALSSARVYVSGRNLATITGYKGMDPEVSTTGLTPGNDNRDQYPTTRMFTAGMTISF